MRSTTGSSSELAPSRLRRHGKRRQGAHEQVDHVVTSCHVKFVGVGLRHELAQRRSKGSLSSTADPTLPTLQVRFWVHRHGVGMTWNGDLRAQIVLATFPYSPQPSY